MLRVFQRSWGWKSVHGWIGWVVHLRRGQKNRVYILTVVDRTTRCILSWDVVTDRTQEAMQTCWDRALGAKQYYSDAFPVYGTLYYGAPFELRTDKRETYSAEAVNADLRHYLKRLAHRSGCFSRKTQALQAAFACLPIVTINDRSWNTNSPDTLLIWSAFYIFQFSHSLKMHSGRKYHSQIENLSHFECALSKSP
jgi:IS1 family transposase